ncbi:hypothetical protein HMPREF1869_01357, partial [Bacteroidales bacterium KA00251]
TVSTYLSLPKNIRICFLKPSEIASPRPLLLFPKEKQDINPPKRKRIDFILAIPPRDYETRNFLDKPLHLTVQGIRYLSPNAKNKTPALHEREYRRLTKIFFLDKE